MIIKKQEYLAWNIPVFSIKAKQSTTSIGATAPHGRG